MSFTFGGVDLSGAAYGLVCAGWDEELVGEGRVDLQDLGGMDGAVSQGTVMGARKMKLECVVVGSSEQNLRLKIDAVKARLDSRLGEQLFTWNREALDLPAALRRSRYCRVMGAVQGQKRGLGWFFGLELVAPSPFDVGAEIVETLSINEDPKTLHLPSGTGAITGASNASPIVITSAGHGLDSGERVTVSGCVGNTAANGTWPVTWVSSSQFSLDGSVGNGAWTSGGTWVELSLGTSWALPVWTIHNTGGPAIDVTLENVTTEETLRMLGGLASGHYFRIDSDRKHVEKSGDGATWMNGMTSKTAGDPFPRLQAGVRNEVLVTGIAAGTLVATWRPRWI